MNFDKEGSKFEKKNVCVCVCGGEGPRFTDTKTVCKTVFFNIFFISFYSIFFFFFLIFFFNFLIFFFNIFF